MYFCQLLFSVEVFVFTTLCVCFTQLDALLCVFERVGLGAGACVRVCVYARACVWLCVCLYVC